LDIVHSKYLSLDSSSFFALHSVIHPRAVTEFIYRYTSSDRAHVLLSFKLSSTNREQEVSDVLSALEKQEMQGYDISDDEMAKSHVRYMIGGCLKVPNEKIFRFGACCPAGWGYINLILHKPSLNGQERCVSSLRGFNWDGIFPCSIIGIMGEVRNTFCIQYMER